MTPEQIEEMKRDAARVPELEAEVLRLRGALSRLLANIDGPSHLIREAIVIEQFGTGPIAEARAALEGKQ